MQCQQLHYSLDRYALMWTVNIYIFNCCHEIMYLKEKCKQKLSLVNLILGQTTRWLRQHPNPDSLLSLGMQGLPLPWLSQGKGQSSLLWSSLFLYCCSWHSKETRDQQAVSLAQPYKATAYLTLAMLDLDRFCPKNEGEFSLQLPRKKLPIR